MKEDYTDLIMLLDGELLRRLEYVRQLSDRVRKQAEALSAAPPKPQGDHKK